MRSDWRQIEMFEIPNLSYLLMDIQCLNTVSITSWPLNNYFCLSFIEVSIVPIKCLIKTALMVMVMSEDKSVNDLRFYYYRGYYWVSHSHEITLEWQYLNYVKTNREAKAIVLTLLAVHIKVYYQQAHILCIFFILDLHLSKMY